MRPKTVRAGRRPGAGLARTFTPTGLGAGGVALDAAGPAQPAEGQARKLIAVVLVLGITAVAGAQYATGHGLIPVAWLAVGPLLAFTDMTQETRQGIATSGNATRSTRLEADRQVAKQETLRRPQS